MSLRKEQFPHLKKSKLLPRGDDTFKIIKKVNDDAYIVEMPREFGGKSNSLEEGEDDAYLEGHSQEDEVEEGTPGFEGPMMKGRLKKIHKEVHK
ncbi:hypothetical protein CR513_14330, partial [Mucuna pruriens]